MRSDQSDERHAVPSLPASGSRPPSSQVGSGKGAATDLTKQEYEQLAAFRYALRQFARQTELEARRIGTTPQQYLLLLAIKGHRGEAAPNISELAESLQIRHNAVVGLVNRAEARGLVQRQEDTSRTDRRVVRISLTADGVRLLGSMAHALRAERDRVRRTLEAGSAD